MIDTMRPDDPSLPAIRRSQADRMPIRAGRSPCVRELVTAGLQDLDRAFQLGGRGIS
jgi:hypothetical protein